MIPEFALRRRRTREDPPVREDTVVPRDSLVFTRDAEATRIFGLATEGVNVEIVGPRCSGRTALMHHIQNLYAQAGLDVVCVRGVGDRLPLEAIRVAVPMPSATGSPQAAPSPTTLLSRLTAMRPPAFLIDDGDNLDEASWTVIETAHKLLGTAIIGSRLHRPGAPAHERALIRFAHPAVRIVLGELDLDVIHELLESRLGGTVSTSLSGRIHTKSAGLPGLALAIVDAAAASGTIRRHRGVWVDDVDLWSGELSAVYEALLMVFDSDLRAGAETLALAGSVDIDTARILVGQPMLEALEQSALIKVFSTRHRALVAVSPPGLSDYFRRQPVTAHRLRLVEGVVDCLDTETTQDADPVQFLRALNDRHETAAPLKLDLPLVARMYTDDYRIETSAACNEWELSRSVPSAIRVLCVALTGWGDDTTADRVVRETSPHTDRAGEELLFRYLRSRWILASGGSGARALQSLTADLTESFEHRGALRAFEIAVQLETESIPIDYASELESIAFEPAIDGDAARLVLAYAHILSSRAADAIPLLARRPLDPDSVLALQYDVAHGLALYASGQLNEAADWATSHAEKCIADVERMALAGHSYVALIALASMGRFDESADAARVVLTASIRGSSMLFASDRAALNAHAIVAMRLGRAAAAAGLLERAEGIRGQSAALPFGFDGLIKAAVMSSSGDRMGAAERYREAAESLSARNYHPAADGAMMLSLISHFDLDVAAEFGPRAEIIGGRLYRAYIDGRSASVHNDAEGLVAAARILREERASDEALRFFTQAVTIFRDAGRQEHSDAIRVEVRDLLADDDSVGSWSSQRSTVNVGLTRRESEIAHYIAAGLSNGQIAERFGISVRTIETHLRNIRKKTGVIDREDIAHFKPVARRR